LVEADLGLDRLNINNIIKRKLEIFLNKLCTLALLLHVNPFMGRIKKPMAEVLQPMNCLKWVWS
jgi:hypothetical protein